MRRHRSLAAGLLGLLLLLLMLALAWWLRRRRRDRESEATDEPAVPVGS